MKLWKIIGTKNSDKNSSSTKNSAKEILRD
jgi:hypothetical protein